MAFSDTIEPDYILINHRLDGPRLIRNTFPRSLHLKMPYPPLLSARVNPVETAPQSGREFPCITNPRHETRNICSAEWPKCDLIF